MADPDGGPWRNGIVIEKKKFLRLTYMNNYKTRSTPTHLTKLMADLGSDPGKKKMEAVKKKARL